MAGSTLGIVIVVIDCLRRRSSAAASSFRSALRIWEGNRVFDECHCLSVFIVSEAVKGTMVKGTVVKE